KISADSEAEIVDRLDRDQRSLRGTIEAMGGEVLATYQHAYNGIKARIAASRIGYLTALPGVVAITTPGVYQLDNAQSVPYIGAPGTGRPDSTAKGSRSRSSIPASTTRPPTSVGLARPPRTTPRTRPRRRRQIRRSSDPPRRR